MGEHVEGAYYVPEPSYWPLVGSIALTTTLVGAANWLHHHWYGPYLFFGGLGILFIMIFGWFRLVIKESLAGLYNEQVEHSFRWGMIWFIFSEVWFFAAFFGALFFSRLVTVPFMGGELYNPITHYLLWPNFEAIWPLTTNPDNTMFAGAYSIMNPWGIPAINTALLLSSGVTITWAHWALKKNDRRHLIIGLGLTILLGSIFLGFQAYEYIEAYTHFNLTLNAGIYGTTFFTLTGLHGLHVTIGTIMLIVIWLRSIVGHFTPDDHFAFEGVAWYWHFVDVVWLFLFVFVYWL